MMDKKTETLRLRISPELKSKFFAACEEMDETPSRVLHSYIKTVSGKWEEKKMKKYVVNFENREHWNSMEDVHDDKKWVVTMGEIKNLANSWGVEIEELMEQVEEI